MGLFLIFCWFSLFLLSFLILVASLLLKFLFSRYYIGRRLVKSLSPMLIISLRKALVSLCQNVSGLQQFGTLVTVFLVTM